MHWIWIALFLVVFFGIFGAASDFENLWKGLGLIVRGLEWLLRSGQRALVGAGVGVVLFAVVMLAHKGTASADIATSVCNLMTHAGAGAEFVPEERRFPLSAYAELEGRCEAQNAGDAAKCPALVTVVENRYTFADYQRVMADSAVGDNGLPDEFTTLENALDACK